MKNKRLLGLFLMVMIICYFSCKTKESHKISITHDVFEKSDSISKIVTQYFQNKNDSFQINASKFILDRLKYAYHYNGIRQRAYTSIIKEFYNKGYVLHDKLDSLKGLSLSDGPEIFDVSTISAEYLIHDIELISETFDKCSWKQDIPFDIFCNYVLPYRINHESIEDWRRSILDSFEIIYDSSFFQKDITLSANLVYQWLHKSRLNFLGLWGKNSLNIPDLPPSVSSLLLMGDCSDLSTISISSMRAMGIPATSDFTPQYLNINSGHDWNAVVLDSSKVIPFDVTNNEGLLGEFKQVDFILSKVYRESIEPIKNNHFSQRGYCGFLPSFFNSPYLLDVTSSYLETSNIIIPLFNEVPKKMHYGYLYVFDYPGWVPIDFGKIVNGNLFCKNLGRGGVYLPLSIDDNGAKIIGNAFILKSDGSVYYLIPNRSDFREIKLYRKFPVLNRYKAWANKMIGGKFQCSNDPDFNEVYELSTIKSYPGLNYNSVLTNSRMKFRYVRYLSPKGSNGNIAEVQFFEDENNINPLTGSIIGTMGSLNNIPDRTRKAAFDGNELTFFDSSQPDNSWVGLDLGTVKSIRKIRFLSRTDKNEIYNNNIYELFFWDNKWISLGTTKADSCQYLVYKNVPGNVLLWLRNLTEGEEERIFTYENGEQIWY